jgi:O-antigen/teichoic acid export membrane protein
MQLAVLRNSVATISRSPLLWPVTMFGVSGVAFAAANIVWARTLPVESYALVALCVAIINLALRFAPFGADLEINREGWALSAAAIGGVVVTCLAAATVAGAVASVGYGLGVDVAIGLAVAVAAGGITAYAAATLQARRRYFLSLAYMHSINYLLLLLSIATAVGALVTVPAIVWAVAGGTLVVLVPASIALVALWRSSVGTDGSRSFRRLLPLVLVTGSAEVLTQLDRLVTPLVLGLGELAQLGVLLALVGPPFRLLEMAVAYAMLPELRSATDAAQRRRALRESATLAGTVSLVAAGLLLLFLAPLSNWLLASKFTLPHNVIVAALLAGLVRVAHGFAGAAATALVPNERLHRLSALGLWSAAIGITGAVVGGQWGLQGVIYGSMTGWIVRTLGSARLVRQALQVP